MHTLYMYPVYIIQYRNFISFLKFSQLRIETKIYDIRELGCSFINENVTILF